MINYLNLFNLKNKRILKTFKIEKKNNFTIWEINTSQFEKLLNILGV